jgi:hypothetical protein
MVPVSPGLMVTGEKGAAGLVANNQRSPVGAVTAGSKPFVCAVIEIVADPAGAEGGELVYVRPALGGPAIPQPSGYGPAGGAVGGRFRRRAQRPWPAARARQSGSPGYGLKSNMAGNVEVCVTERLDVSVGTNQVGKSLTSAATRCPSRWRGQRDRLRGVQPGVDEEVLGRGAVVGDRHGHRHRHARRQPG